MIYAPWELPALLQHISSLARHEDRLEGSTGEQLQFYVCHLTYHMLYALYTGMCVCVCQNTSIYVFINPKICFLFHKKYASSGNVNTSGHMVEMYTVFLKYTNSVLGRALCREVTYEIGNVRKTQQWGAFVQPLLKWKGDEYYICWVYVCSLSYSACKAHMVSYIVVCGLSGSTVFFHNIL